jgi:hypothetical protein
LLVNTTVDPDAEAVTGEFVVALMDVTRLDARAEDVDP